ncbi:MAG: type I-C CRISPR-associated protein Cas8c/Csd1 [Phocaeicola vulgatus]|nr:MAG: type I-C CRISPR-associated protein Cas8c/Csd1 [Phocaeicola vulgatus]
MCLYHSSECYAAKGSHNKFGVGNRTFVFWASSNSSAAEQTEESLFDLLGFTDEEQDDPNAKIEQVRKVFTSIYSGTMKTSLDDRFYILGLAPNSARIAVVYWSECSLKDFAEKILRHFNDMEIIDTRKEGKPYMGIKSMLAAVTLNGKQSEATPNLPEAVVKSIFQGTPYPFTLFSACIRRIRAESGKDAIRIARMAIIKAYLNRIKDNNKKIDTMLDKSNTNQGYLCGRLFAVLDKIQEDANGIRSICERYMNAASATPASVFATILNLSSHHMEKLTNESRKIFYEKMKQEIIDKIPATGFPAHLDLQDQGRFFIGYYHQRQDFFTKKEDENKN